MPAFLARSTEDGTSVRPRGLAGRDEPAGGVLGRDAVNQLSVFTTREMPEYAPDDGGV